MKTACTHLDQVQTHRGNSHGCEECLKAGGSWVHLRLCLRCGHVGCCDDSVGKHASLHFGSSGHPIMKSIEPGEEWGWCYVDNVMFDRL